LIGDVLLNRVAILVVQCIEAFDPVMIGRRIDLARLTGFTAIPCAEPGQPALQRCRDDRASILV
jgi:hypothetical protein